MAKTVYTAEEVALEDGKEVTLKPLTIAKMKRAMAYLDEDHPAESVNDGYDFLTGLVKICLKGQLDDDYDLEENLDQVTAKRIVLVCTGIDLDDTSNLVAMAAAQSGGTSI